MEANKNVRELDEHKINPANDRLRVYAVDEPGPGGANHAYRILGFNSTSNPSGLFVGAPGDPCEMATILFQHGPISEDGVGVNGLTHEALLDILADRLRAFQKGPYACKENACALTHLEEAMHWLQQRTLKRMRRGVEGTHTV